MAERFTNDFYRDRVVTTLVVFSVIWAVVGMVAGVYVAAELIWPTLDFGQPWLSFGRVRTLHTNVVIFGFGVSALMGTAFYSVQRTCHVSIFSPALAWKAQKSENTALHSLTYCWLTRQAWKRREFVRLG